MVSMIPRSRRSAFLCRTSMARNRCGRCHCTCVCSTSTYLGWDASISHLCSASSFKNSSAISNRRANRRSCRSHNRSGSNTANGNADASTSKNLHSFSANWAYYRIWANSTPTFFVTEHSQKERDPRKKLFTQSKKRSSTLVSSFWMNQSEPAFWS